MNAANGLMLIAVRPIKGRFHEWNLYLSCILEKKFHAASYKEENIFNFYSDSGYGERCYLEVLFQFKILSLTQKALNYIMHEVRIEFEWVFRKVKKYFATFNFKKKMKMM